MLPAQVPFKSPPPYVNLQTQRPSYLARALGYYQLIFSSILSVIKLRE